MPQHVVRKNVLRLDAIFSLKRKMCIRDSLRGLGRYRGLKRRWRAKRGLVFRCSDGHQAIGTSSLMMAQSKTAKNFFMQTPLFLS